MTGMRIQRIRSIAKLAGAIATAMLPLIAVAQENQQGSIIMQRAMLTNIVRNCSTAYPQLAPTMQAQLDAWHAERTDANKGADAFIASLPPDNRAELDKLVGTLQKTASDMLTAAQHQGSGEGFCAKAFDSFGTTDSRGYYDADNVGEAFGMYYLTMTAAEIAREICVARYPQLASHADDALTEWRKREASIIAVVESRMSRMQQENPSAAEDIKTMMVQRARELITTAIDSGKEVYCRKHFDDLAEGNHRRNTPKTYLYLEQESSAQ